MGTPNSALLRSIGLVITIALMLARSSCCAQAQASGGERATAGAIEGRVFDQLWTATDLHFHKGEYCHIIHICQITVAARPHQVEAYANAAWLLWSLNLEDRAVRLYQEGIQANPRTSYLMHECGFYYFVHRKDYKNALKYYQMAASCSDAGIPDTHSLAHAYEAVGDLSSAEHVWEKAAADPTDGAARANLARVKRAIAAHNR